jgi:hypothetical protein
VFDLLAMVLGVGDSSRAFGGLRTTGRIFMNGIWDTYRDSDAIGNETYLKRMGEGTGKAAWANALAFVARQGQRFAAPSS